MIFTYQIPGDDLLVHVIEQFSSSILPNYLLSPFEWIDQMPMPMVKIDTKIFPEIGYTMLDFQIGSCVIPWYFYWNLKEDLEALKISLKMQNLPSGLQERWLPLL